MVAIAVNEIGFDVTLEKSPLLRSGLSINLNENEVILDDIDSDDGSDDDIDDDVSLVAGLDCRSSSATCCLLMSPPCVSVQTGDGQWGAISRPR